MFGGPVLRHRLFFAVRPPLILARQIVNGAQWFDTAGRGLRPEHLHVTMDILDDLDAMPRSLERMLLDIGASVRVAPFEIAFDLAVGSTRSIALRSRRRILGIGTLRDAIVDARQAAGVAEREGYAFSPHMTIGYRDGAPFSQGIAPIGWKVDELMLIHSHLGKTRHDVLGRWPLTNADPDQLSLF